MVKYNPNIFCFFKEVRGLCVLIICFLLLVEFSLRILLFSMTRSSHAWNFIGDHGIAPLPPYLCCCLPQKWKIMRISIFGQSQKQYFFPGLRSTSRLMFMASLALYTALVPWIIYRYHIQKEFHN